MDEGPQVPADESEVGADVGVFATADSSLLQRPAPPAPTSLQGHQHAPQGLLILRALHILLIFVRDAGALGAALAAGNLSV